MAGGGGEHFGPYPWLQEFAQAGRTRQVHYDRLMSHASAPARATCLRARDPEGRRRRGLRPGRPRPPRRALRRQPNTTQLDAIYAYKSTGHFGAYRSASAAHLRQRSPATTATSSPPPSPRTTAGATPTACTARWSSGSSRRWRAIETERGGPAQLMRPGQRPALRPLLPRGSAGPPSARCGGGPRRRLDAGADPGGLPRRGPPAARRRRRSTPGVDALGRALRAIGRSRRSSPGPRSPAFTGWSMLGRIATIELTLREVDDAGL